MISKWDIITKTRRADAAIICTLVMDGTEADVRLLAQKLNSYVQSIKTAPAPYTYRLQLIEGLDKNALKKIRTFVQQCVQQINAAEDVNEEESTTFVNLDATDSFLRPQAPVQTAAPLPPEQPLSLDKQEASAAAAQAQHKAPSAQKPAVQKQTGSTDPLLDDIFNAQTKYDMFVDVPKKDTATTAGQTPTNTQQTDAFNVFDQKIKDQTAFMDVSDVEDITERLSQKDLEFIKHASLSTQPPAPTQAQAGAATQKSVAPAAQEEALDPFEQLVTAKTTSNTDDIVDPGFHQAASTLPEEVASTNQKKKKDIAQQAISSSNTEKHMATDNLGETKNTFHLKRKNTQPPPKPTQPAAPKAPQAAQAPSAIPSLPDQAPTLPSIPPAKMNPEKTMTLHLKNPAETTKRHTIIPKSATPADKKQQTIAPKAPPAAQTTAWGRPATRRRPNPAGTFLEKTRTIDHSIEMPLSELNQHNWPLEMPLIPTYTLENMTISVNRFAHATAISVIENPGKLYNPLVLYGASGTGKTHFLHAIGYALSKKYGQENIFITNGVRLSRGIQRYITEGNIEKFEQFCTGMKALLIDDIHLISINEQNKNHLSKLLHDFRAQNKQIIITSKYPPENLAKLEELLNFKLDSGWISELKQAGGQVRMRIIQQMLANNGLDISTEDTNRFFGHPTMSLGTVVRSIRRVRVLEKLIAPDKQEASRGTALAIFDQLLATKGEDQSSLISRKSPNDIHSISVIGNKEWGRIGIFYPQHNSNMMNWLVFALQQRAQELGISGGPDLAVRSSYSTENIISSAFKIANLCDNKKLKGALILGPSLDMCEPSVRDNFYDILTHMLEIMLIRCGVVNIEDASSPSTYVEVLSELLK